MNQTSFESFDSHAVLTLDRPDIRNALTGSEMLDEIVSAVTEPGAPVLIITGRGPAFSAGGNVKDMADQTGIFDGTPLKQIDSYRSSIQRLTRALHDTDVITIAAVNGPAVGAGFDLALGCDIRIGARNCWFSHSFVDLGIIPGDGGAWLLPRVVGWQRAALISYTGRRVDADTALEWDILAEVVDGEALLGRANELAATIAAKPSHSLRLTKRLLKQAHSMGLDGFLELSAAFQAASHGEPAHQAAVAGYLRSLKGKN